MKVLHAKSGDSVGVPLNTVSFRSLLRALRSLPGVEIRHATHQPLNDEAFASFDYKGVQFEVHTPLSDYWIDRPVDCPQDIFDEIARHLEKYRVRWWHRLL